MERHAERESIAGGHHKAGLKGVSETRRRLAVSIPTSGHLILWHHHGHQLITDGNLSHDAAAPPVPMRPDDQEAFEDVACHLMRARLSLKKFVYLDDHKGVLYPTTSRTRASTGPTPTPHYPNRVRSRTAPAGALGR